MVLAGAYVKGGRIGEYPAIDRVCRKLILPRGDNLVAISLRGALNGLLGNRTHGPLHSILLP